MPSYKKQHYVPKCHLRPFSPSVDGRSISLYLINSDKIVTKASIRDQCSRDYFYGDDGLLESALAGYEALYARFIRNIERSPYLISSEDKHMMTYFLLLQSRRTAKKVLETQKSMKRMYEFISLPDRKRAEEVVGPVPDHNSAMISSMKAVFEVIEQGALDDLKFVIVKNETGRAFVTSDHPAVITNRWQIQRLRRTSFGIGSAGLLIFMPLGPKYIAIAYDGDVYSIVNRNGLASTSRHRDVLAFNLHQYIQAESSIYFGAVEEAAVIKAEARSYLSLRPAEWDNLHVARFAEQVGEHRHYVVDDPSEVAKSQEAIMHLESVYPIPPIWPKLIEIRNNASGYEVGMSLVRRSIACNDIVTESSYRKVIK